MKDFRKYALYYKGEKESPFNDNKIKNTFWNLEKQYINNSIYPETYEKIAIDYMDANKSSNNILTSDAPIERKAFVCFAEDMLAKWDPNNINIIKEYGK